MAWNWTLSLWLSHVKLFHIWVFTCLRHACAIQNIHRKSHCRLKKKTIFIVDPKKTTHDCIFLNEHLCRLGQFYFYIFKIIFTLCTWTNVHRSHVSHVTQKSSHPEHVSPGSLGSQSWGVKDVIRQATHMLRLFLTCEGKRRLKLSAK